MRRCPTSKRVNCAAPYSRSWVGMPIEWRGTSRRSIPDNWHFIGQRSSPYHLAGNRNAAHPVNAILNYAYAALESETRIKAISDGFDPTIGIMHEGSDGSSKFICDLMEPERPRVDRAVLDFVKGRFSTRPTLSFVPTVFAGSIQKWHGWWWRRFLHRKSFDAHGPEPTLADIPARIDGRRIWPESGPSARGYRTNERRHMQFGGPGAQAVRPLPLSSATTAILPSNEEPFGKRPGA